MAKRFSVKKGSDGLIQVDDGNGPRQVTTYTKDGDELRFSLAGHEGDFYTVRKGSEDFDDLDKAFHAASEAGEKKVEAAEKKAEPGHAKG